MAILVFLALAGVVILVVGTLAGWAIAVSIGGPVVDVTPEPKPEPMDRTPRFASLADQMADVERNRD
ncbi:hypothetical protein [Leifsonia sp. Leaf264]|uniref:hypothetical protein n=1 Tax=Leifsonia sp. Leaf264 TaxID=1736314 RepID=UPI0006F255BC|nr:hypothetical protein [Leifsonia sp. Leaf264]KQO98566.1 hypothetical protein ASF30_10925 [Leifsonia sp. Leaf264]